MYLTSNAPVIFVVDVALFVTDLPAPGRVDRGDAEEFRLAAEGDIDAFGRVYARHAARVHMLARRFVGPDDADDATQEIFIRAWERMRQFRGDSTVGTWLHRLGVNVLIRRAEAQRDRPATAVSEQLRASGESPDLAIDIDAALGRLDPDLRTVVVLHDVEGFAHDEIASLLGISPGSSRMRLHRARLALRAWIVG